MTTLRKAEYVPGEQDSQEELRAVTFENVPAWQ
jgi:hypothetical protein